MNTINGIPLIWNEEEDNQLFGQLLSNFNNSDFPANTTSKNFPVFKSPLAEKERPEGGSKLLTNKPLSVFDNDFGYWVTANKYLSGKEVVNSFKKITPRDNEIIFLCETDDSNKSNLFGTLFLVKIGSKFKSLLYSLSQGEVIKINSKLNTNSSTSANQVSSFNALLKEIYHYLETNYTSYIEQDFLTFDRLKNMIEDEVSFTKQAKRTIGEIMAWQNDGLEYLMNNSDAFFESIMFQKKDYTPEKETDYINEIADFFTDVADYILPDSVEEMLNQMLSKVKNFIQDKLPENWKKLLLKLQAYMEQALDILNIISNDVYKGYYIIKAYFCGLVNGLLATVQFIIQAFCWLNKNHASKLFTGELYLSIQSSLESIEDFIDAFYETKDDLIAGMKKLIHDFELESLLAIAKTLYGNNLSSYTVYDYAYLTGRIIFEIVIAVLLTLFTGGGEVINLASSLSEMAKLVGKETLSVVSGGIVDFAALLKSFLLKFAQAAKKGWKALQEFFEELLGNSKPKELEIDKVVLFEKVVKNKTLNIDEIYKIKYFRPKGLYDKLTYFEVVKKFGKRGGELFNVVEKEWELTRIRLTSGNARMKEVLVSGMIDKETGKISKTFSNFTDDDIFLGKHLDFIKKLHPTLKKRLTEHIKRVGKNGKGLNLDDPEVYKFAWKSIDNAHAEFRALDDILWKIDPKGELGESAINRILGYNSFLKKEGIQHTCADCFYLTYGVTYIK